MQPSNRRLIVVDDEPGLLEAYRTIFSPAAAAPTIVSSRSKAVAPVTAPSGPGPQYEVTYCSTGEDALLKIETAVKAKTPFVGGFFDVKLGPGIDGIETIKRSQGLDPHLLVCIVSAYQDRSLEEIAKVFGEEFDGQWDFLMKPFGRMEIAQKARNMVANWEWRRTRRAA